MDKKENNISTWGGWEPVGSEFRKESEKIRGTCLDITLGKVMQRRAKSK